MSLITDSGFIQLGVIMTLKSVRFSAVLLSLPVIAIADRPTNIATSAVTTVVTPCNCMVFPIMPVGFSFNLTPSTFMRGLCTDLEEGCDATTDCYISGIVEWTPQPGCSPATTVTTPSGFSISYTNRVAFGHSIACDKGLSIQAACGTETLAEMWIDCLGCGNYGE